MPSANLSEFDPNGSVLFLGSGFSTESINLKGARPMTGSGLRKHFIRQIGLPNDTTYDFQVLAEEYNFKSQGGLYKDLYDFFHISKVSKNQAEILNQPWLRIYTTNYDDTAETFSTKPTMNTARSHFLIRFQTSLRSGLSFTFMEV